MRRLPVLSRLRTVYPNSTYSQSHMSRVIQQFCLSKSLSFPYPSDVAQIFTNSGIQQRQHIFPPESIFQPASFGDVYQPTVDKMVELGATCVKGILEPNSSPNHIFSSTSM